MNYEQAVEVEVSKGEALEEVRKHGCSVEEFLTEMGDKESYQGAEVLTWLGY